MTRRRLCTGAALTALVIATWSATASAHVTIDPGDAPAGGSAILHFVVPNESETASTVKVEIAMPQGVVLPFVLAEPITGWNVTVQTSPLETPIETDDGTFTEAVSVVTFDGGEIKPGQFQQFNLEVDPLPDQAGTTLTFPAVQTYSDGQEVRWVDATVEGQPEPEHPAPSVHLVDATADNSASSDDSDSNALAIVAIVVGAAALVVGGMALARSRNRPTS